MRTRYAIAALLLIPLADALLLVVVADALGWQATVLLVVLTGLVGMLLVRAEGRHTLARIQEKAGRGEPPTNELLDGALLIAAGAFLLTPGVVTDTLGFLLTIPPTRYPIRALLKKYVVVPKLDERTNGFVTGGVWTGGFPNDDGASNPFQGNGDGSPFGGGNAGPFDGAANDPGSDDRSDDGQRGDDVYDVGADEYRTKADDE